jgi:hypothetical protein
METENENEAPPATVSEEQASVMDEVLDIPDEPAEDKPAEKPAEKEPQGTPEAEADKAKDDQRDKSGQDEPSPKDETKGEKSEPVQKDPKKDDKKDQEITYEVATRDGVKNVPLSALKTTYQQFGALQARHQEVKPFFDLSKESGIPVDKMFQFAVIGIRAVHEASQRSTVPLGATQEKPAGGYQGPFESEQQEAELKESDPILYKTTKTLWDQNQNLSKQLVTLVGRLEQAQTQRAGTPQQTSAGGGGPSPERQRVDGLLAGMQKAHEPYFKQHPERMEAFKEFLGSKFASVPLPTVDDGFIGLAFQLFDPVYYAAWKEAEVAKKLGQRGETRRRTFGESDSVRGGTASSMTEQQELMADILNF